MDSVLQSASKHAARTQLRRSIKDNVKNPLLGKIITSAALILAGHFLSKKL